MVKVANLTFDSFVNDSRVEKISKTLSNNRYRVEVIAHLDKGLAKEEKRDNYFVKRFSYLDREVTRGKFSKLKVYLEYIAKSVKYCKDFDILHCNDLNTLPIAFIIKRFYNKDIKVVYDAHEHETETNTLKGWQQKVAKFLEKSLIKYANRVICVSDAIANDYAKSYNIEKPAVVLNTPSYKEVKKHNIFREKFNISKDKTIFIYQGVLSPGRGIEVILETFKNLSSNDNAVIVFMGFGLLEELIKEYANKYENIYFHEAVTPDVILNYTSSADFGISTIEDSCLSYRYCLPNKMFEYIMANLLLIVSNLPEMKRVVIENNIGVVAKENTPKGLKEAIYEATKLDKNRLQANLERAKKIFNWQKQESILLNIYNSLEEK